MAIGDRVGIYRDLSPEQRQSIVGRAPGGFDVAPDDTPLYSMGGDSLTYGDPSAMGFQESKEAGGGKSIFDYIAPIAQVALAFVPGVGPALSAGMAGIRAGINSGDPLTGLLSAGGSYFGSSLGSQLGSTLGNQLGGTLAQTPANAIGDVIGGEALGAVAPFGSFAGNALGSQTIGSLAGSAIGSSAGQSFGEGLGQQLNPTSLGGTMSLGGPPGFSPSKQPAMGLPQSLSQFSGLSPQQQGSNIATKGVYGGGNGPQETNYFMNLMNRQLFDQGGNVDRKSVV